MYSDWRILCYVNIELVTSKNKAKGYNYKLLAIATEII